MDIFNDKTKRAALIFVGPLGCYVAYQLLFIGKYLDPEKYPLLTAAYANGAAIADPICALLVAILGFVVVRKFTVLDRFGPNREPLATVVHMLITAGILALLALSIYRVLGTLQPAYVLKEYQTYNFKATDGGAWMILAMYAALFLQLMDMYFSGVTRKNGVFLLVNILIVSFSGGRGILILFALMFIVLLMFQRVSLWKFLLASSLAIASVGTSFVLITDMRAPATHHKVIPHHGPKVPGVPTEETDPTDSYEDMNYNAAFISEDVLAALQNHDIEPRAYALEDAMMTFVPRKLFPGKPISTAETRAIYPDVAKRGTNITFPLKANVLMHLGRSGFYFDWVVVALCQTLMVFGIARRTSSPGLAGFAMLFCGLGFTLVARGGIFNARLLVIGACILSAYVGYKLLLRIQELRAGKSSMDTLSH